MYTIQLATITGVTSSFSFLDSPISCIYVRSIIPVVKTILNERLGYQRMGFDFDRGMNDGGVEVRWTRSVRHRDLRRVLRLFQLVYLEQVEGSSPAGGLGMRVLILARQIRRVARRHCHFRRSYTCS